MNLSKIVVHQIEKTSGATTSTLILSDYFLDNDDLSVRLISDLNDKYTKQLINRAIFDNQPSTFSQEFIAYNSNSSNQAFLNFTKKSTTSLNDTIKNVPLARGGYLVFAEYKISSGVSFVSVFMIRNTDGLIFNRDPKTGKLEIVQQVQIDFEKMAVACRINMNIYNSSSEDRYLNFITGRNEPVSEYFRKWLNGTDFEDEKKDTEYLIKIANEIIPLPKDDDGEEITRDEFKEKLFYFISGTPNKEVNLETLDQHFYQGKPTIRDWVENNEMPISSTFKARADVLRKLYKISVNADKISLTFPHELWSKKIISVDDKNRLIIHSNNLVDKIKNEIAGN